MSGERQSQRFPDMLLSALFEERLLLVVLEGVAVVAVDGGEPLLRSHD